MNIEPICNMKKKVYGFYHNFYRERGREGGRERERETEGGDYLSFFFLLPDCLMPLGCKGGVLFYARRRKEEDSESPFF
jgi:hypothetical protein